MELAFVPLEQSGWRGRGAPRKEVPPQTLDMLRRTTGGEVGVIDTRGDTDAEIREVIAELRAGARQLHRRVKIQHDADHDRIRFQLGDAL